MKADSFAALCGIEILEARIAPAIFTVINVMDSGAGSLRDALGKAFAEPGVDTIVFDLPPPPLHEENVIELGSQLGSGGNVIIKGPGAGKLIIDGNNAGRVFRFTDGSTKLAQQTDSPVVIKGLSITGGNPPPLPGGIDEPGGGILSTESLTLKNVVVSGNTATGGFGGVAVLYTSESARVTISNSVIANNSGGGIGAIRVNSLSIIESVITGNTTEGDGGGIFASVNKSGTGIAIIDSVITGNSADSGGGLRLDNSSLLPTAKTVISGTKITGNTATSNPNSGDRGGGGLFILDGDTAIVGSTIRNNTANYYAGGILAEDFGSLTISTSIISGNQTTNTQPNYQGGGGGLCLIGGGDVPLNRVNIIDTTIANNHSSSIGGGILAFNGVALTLSGDTLSGNDSVGSGGGLQTTGDGLNKVKLTVTDGVFINNVATLGGGICAAGDGVIAITGSTVTGNHAIDAGGIFARSSGSVAIQGVTATGNFASNKGGGLFIDTTPDFEITGGSFNGNTAKQGGGIYLTNATGSIVDVTISGNTSTDTGGTAGGGGLDIHSGKITITGATVRHNTAVYNGGGIKAADFESLTISKSLISGNQTTKTNATYQGGGGLFLKGKGTAPLNPVKIVDTTVSDNDSASLGGGVLAFNGLALAITRDTFARNDAIGSGGGLVTTGDGLSKVDLTVKSGRFSDNVSSLLGGGISAAGDGVISIAGAKVSGNQAIDAGGVFARSSVSVTIEDVTATRNSASGGSNARGGGLFIGSTPKFEVSGGSFKGNMANEGGGLYISSSAGKISDVTISGNMARTKGGGVFQSGPGSVELEIAKVVANSAPVDPNVSGTFV